MRADSFHEFADKMNAAGCSTVSIRAFEASYRQLLSGESGLIPEREIEPVTQLPRLEEVAAAQARQKAPFEKVAVIKLNGGLGTSMGLEKAKSLLVVKNGLTFLDFIVRQIRHVRQANGPVRFLLMNSFSTSRDTREFLGRYPDLGEPSSFELMQNQVPKVDACTLRPVQWPQTPSLEWCPPGHGDIYPALFGSGWLDRLQNEGVQFLFVSNSDNLGATLDPALLCFFEASGQPFLMEVAQRTTSDRKGGHLARQGSQLLLRESAQCPEEDQESFQNISRHQFFNTNNLWIRVDALRDAISTRGYIPLPMIRNSKTADSRDKRSTAVYQLETAMGAAIGCFEGAGAILVPRSRFAPVKTTGDLLALRSDAYRVTPDWRVELDTEHGQPPTLDLDSEHYKLVDQLEARTAGGVPSLRGCRELKVRGAVELTDKLVFQGKVSVLNRAGAGKPLAPGVYKDREVFI